MRTHNGSHTSRTRTVTWVGILAALVGGSAFGRPAYGVGGIHEAAVLTASDAAESDYFGTRAAIDGDTAVVGAYVKDGTGAAYVFVRTNGVWEETAKLTASDAATNDGFGYAVAIAGDTIVIGAIYADPNGVTDAGAVYVFDGSGGTWMESAKLTAYGGEEGDFFGGSVAIAGDRLLGGAMYADHYSGRMDAGAVYTFDRVGGVWSETDKLVAADPMPDDHFGYSVALDANTAIIGAADDDLLDTVDAGSAYVFVHGTYWTQAAKLTASDAAESDYFGASVSISGDTAIVGAYGNAAGGLDDAGAAYVFVRSGGVWTQTAKLAASDAAEYDQFGISLAVVGDRAVIGADFVESVGETFTDVGAAYSFVRYGGVWRQAAKLTPSDPTDVDLLGISVALAGDTILCGAPNSGHSGVSSAGAVYVYDARRIGGDMNCDGVLSYADINPFVLAVSDRTAYEARYPSCYWLNADCNFDELVSYADINPFIAVLTAP